MLYFRTRFSGPHYIPPLKGMDWLLIQLAKEVKKVWAAPMFDELSIFDTDHIQKDHLDSLSSGGPAEEIAQVRAPHPGAK
jgi:hypothetical protein